MSFQNFANTYSLLDAPTQGSPNGVPLKVVIENSDSPDFELSPEGDLITTNPGKWSFIAQLQLFFVSDSCYFNHDVAIVDGFFSVNDVKVPFSDAGNSVSKYAPKNVLTIGLAVNLNVGDRVSLSVASTNTNVGICKFYPNDGNTYVGLPTNNTGVVAPSVILTATKIPELP